MQARVEVSELTRKLKAKTEVCNKEQDRRQAVKQKLHKMKKQEDQRSSSPARPSPRLQSSTRLRSLVPFSQSGRTASRQPRSCSTESGWL